MSDQNLLRTAKVSKVDYENGMVSVVYNDKGQSVSASMPMMNFNDEYYMPSIGSQVQVMLLSNGSSRGVVLGNTWEKGNKPQTTGKGIYRKDLSKTPDACTVKYDDASGEYQLQSGVILLYAMSLLKLAGATINIDANGKIIIDTALVEFGAPAVTITGGEDAMLEITNEADLTFTSEEKTIESKIKSVKKEILETYEMTAKQDVKLETELAHTLKAGTDINMEDATYKTTLSSILERLEALDGDTSARK